jgi:hypothetical protein
MRARRVHASADLTSRGKLGALRPKKFFGEGEAPEKRNYDYGLDYANFVPPEKRSVNKH